MTFKWNVPFKGHFGQFLQVFNLKTVSKIDDTSIQPPPSLIHINSTASIAATIVSIPYNTARVPANTAIIAFSAVASKFICWYHKDCYRHSGSFHCYRCYCSATTVTSATTTTITDPNALYVTRTQPLTSYLTATNSRIMTTLPPPLPSPSPSSFWLHHSRHTNTTKTLLPFLIS